MQTAIVHKKRTHRKKTNFMIDEAILENIKNFIPAGARSDFVNQALEEKIVDFMRKEAFDAIGEFRKKRKDKPKMDAVTFIRNSRHHDLL